MAMTFAPDVVNTYPSPKLDLYAVLATSGFDVHL
jgi:hypothetical protein